MKQPVLLKTILDICFFLLIIKLASAVIGTGFLLISKEIPIPIIVNGEAITQISTFLTTYLLGEIIIAGLSVYAIFKLRKLIRNFFKGKLYTLFQIHSLRLIGRLILIITLLTTVLEFGAALLISEQLRIGLKMDSTFGSFWFVLALGLFFMYLATIFEQARILKEDNELTI